MDFVPVEKLAVWKHSPAKKRAPKARVILVHGLSEHSGRHLGTIAALNDANLEVVRFDLRGSGKSGGRRQWVSAFEDYVFDLSTVYNWTCRELEEMPLYILGHSMGGAVAIHFAAIYGGALRGLVLSAPAYRIGASTPSIKIAVGKLFAKSVPNFRVPRGTDQAALSRDPEVVKAYLADPLVSPFNTLQQGAEILRGFAETPKKIAEVSVPLLVVHGSSDRVVQMAGSFELLQNCPSRDKTLHILPGGYHEPHTDLDRELYFSLLAQWFEHRVPKTKRESRAKAG